MRAVVQRVRAARVRVAEEEVGGIGRGLLVFLGVSRADGAAEATSIADKLRGLRIFEDEHGKMNLSVGEVGGSVLVVSQFTLYGDCRRGRRPSFDEAAPPELAEALYEDVIRALAAAGLPVARGVFRARMAVELVNDGPVTILLDSARQF